MCLFKKENFREARKANALVGAGIVTIILSILLPIVIRPSENLVPAFTSAQLSISAVGFILVIVALCFTMESFQKSLAKPRIIVAFSEKGEQEATLTCESGKSAQVPSLWLINKGNAVARYFQIDFIIPTSSDKQSRDIGISVPARTGSTVVQSQYNSIVTHEGNYIVSYTNDGRYTLFVNRPYLDPNIVFSASIYTKKPAKANEDSFEVEYRIYGYWAETQEGKLKVNINKT